MPSPNPQRFRLETRSDVEDLLASYGAKPVKVCTSSDNTEWTETEEWGVGRIVHYVIDQRRKHNASFIMEVVQSLMTSKKVVTEMSGWGSTFFAFTYKRNS